MYEAPEDYGALDFKVNHLLLHSGSAILVA
jgi:hypothetical protein